ncbi:MAG TPA: FAD-dependent oxidoreductase, partial [Ktedonobacteraceae bacterium]|nr:FAD-dependent oxidoreductase [Ktedonobacteraceae bacterium]
GQRELDFDYLVYALGSMTNLNNVPGVKDYAYSLQPRGPRSAVDLRERLADLGAKGGRVVVCGGGATGIETATQVASVYPQLKVSLVTREALAHAWDKHVADIFLKRLASLNIELLDQREIKEVLAQSVLLAGGDELACDLCIWTTGFTVQPLARESGLTVNERDQVLVNPFLHAISHPQIYAIGDAAMPIEKPGVPHVRMSAFTASIMAAHAADCMSAELAGKQPRPLSFSYVAQAVALGEKHALFLPLTPDDRPARPTITGRLGAFTREMFVGFVVTATLSQHRFPAMFSWTGKGRYARQQRQGSLEKSGAQQAHHLS